MEGRPGMGVEPIRGLLSPLTKELRKRVSTPEELPEDLLGAAEGEGEARPTATRFRPGWASSCPSQPFPAITVVDLPLMLWKKRPDHFSLPLG